MAKKRTEAEWKQILVERQRWEYALWHADQNAKAQGLILTYEELMPLAQVLYDADVVRLEAQGKEIREEMHRNRSQAALSREQRKREARKLLAR